MENLQPNNRGKKKGYKQIDEEIDLAQEMFDKGNYSLDEYEAILHQLKQEYDELVKERAFRFSLKSVEYNNKASSMGYKQIYDGLDMASILYDEGVYSIDEYEAIMNGLKQEYYKLIKKRK